MELRYNAVCACTLCLSLLMPRIRSCTQQQAHVSVPWASLAGCASPPLSMGPLRAPSLSLSRSLFSRIVAASSAKSTCRVHQGTGTIDWATQKVTPQSAPKQDAGVRSEGGECSPAGRACQVCSTEGTKLRGWQCMS